MLWIVCIYCGFVRVDFHVLLLGCGVIVCIIGLSSSWSRMYVVGVGFIFVVCKVVRAFWSTRCVSCLLVCWFVCSVFMGYSFGFVSVVCVCVGIC